VTNDQASSLAFILFGGLICAASIGYSLGTLSAPDSGLMPFLTGAGMVLLGGAGFVDATLRRRRGEGWEPVLRGMRWQKSILVVAALAAYALLLKPLGFLLCTCLLLIFLLRAIAPQRWPVVIGGALAASGVAYAVFELWLQAQLPKGWLGL
jgi:putative tricarboxylic transport membrane protein